MSEPWRLPSEGRTDRSQTLHFEFNGKAYTGRAGDTLAAALLANGVHFVARSFKYHRPRGILSAGVEEPNAIVQLESGPHTIPNARATEVLLYDGLRATSVNARPSLENDRLAIMQRLAPFMAAGFYYKTFMWPRRWWGRYEERIRDAAGLGTAPEHPDPDHYDKRFAHCDVLVVGAGPAGLAAACSAARAGARVLLVEQDAEPGGSLLANPIEIDGRPATEWVAARMAELQELPDVRILLRTSVAGYHDHDFVVACERCHDHLPLAQRRGVRERLWKIRPRRVVLATGAHERPLVFGSNDLPGVMLAGAVSAYIHRHGVLAGRNAVLFTNNDLAYQCAIDLQRCGAQVLVVDPRAPGQGALPAQAAALGIAIHYRTVVAAAEGGRHVKAVRLQAYRSTSANPARTMPDLTPTAANPASTSAAARPEAPNTVPGASGVIACDLLAMSGGFNPVVHLHAQARGHLHWDDALACFTPIEAPDSHHRSAGAAAGLFDLQQALDHGVSAGRQAAAAALGDPVTALPPAPRWQAPTQACDPILPLWLIGPVERANRGPKQFIDYQNDVQVADILLSVREGYRSAEHVKRYTSMGFGTDQGKLGNINGMAVLALLQGKRMAETGTTTFRPNYTPISFGAIAGRELGVHFDPVRKTSLHAWNVTAGARFEDVGQWKRAHYYPRPGESMVTAVARECLAVRKAVGLLDYATLGKIDVRGPHAAEFLNRMYINAFTRLRPGLCRYGVMLDENGMVMDDGVILRLAEDHFLVTTTSAGAARVLAWMEQWLQTEWPELRVFLTSISDQYSVATVAGPQARKVLQAVCHDVDLSPTAFPFMSFQDGHIDGMPVRVLRVSFSGELSYEIYVPADLGRPLWERLMQAGAPHGITPYGTEAMHVLRAEKGYVIVGQDTDGSVSPIDLGLGGMVSKTKDFLGKRSLARSHTAGSGRKQLVGLLTQDPTQVLPEGGQILQAPTTARLADMQGHVTSSYASPVLGHSIALALLRDGHSRMGESLTVATADGQFMGARVCSPVFYDPDGARQHVE
ncbi:FAD-dependent oxidoreductase [Castellaniella sp.]|uniref:FAD-dependent oxidoreductase n=1 Tax=Castellaniella sp. TaxID=1955812 RepID=UPI00355CF503